MIKLLPYIIIPILLFVLISKINFKKNSKKKNLYLVFCTILIIVSFGVYEYSMSKNTNKLISVAQSFQSNQKLVCSNKVIDNTKYILNYGTFSLVGTHNIINLKDCNEYRK